MLHNKYSIESPNTSMEIFDLISDLTRRMIEVPTKELVTSAIIGMLVGFVCLSLYVWKKYSAYFEHRKKSLPSTYKRSSCMKHDDTVINLDKDLRTTAEDTATDEETSDGNYTFGMDHMYLSFQQLLWAYTFVGLASYWKAITGIGKLYVRKLLLQLGWIEMEPFDAREVVAKLVLEQSQVIQYKSLTRHDDGAYAAFHFVNFPYIDNDAEFKVAKMLSVTINVDTMRMEDCNMDGTLLFPSQALILLFFNTIGAQHVKIHAVGSWSVSSNHADASTYGYDYGKGQRQAKLEKASLRRNSTVTAMYNHAGYVGFMGFLDGGQWERLGLLSQGWNSKPLKAVFDYSIQQKIVEHLSVSNLVPYSEMVRFVVKVRSIFYREFAKHKHHFPGIHCEALFAGTVLHSVDHALAEWNLKDPLWLDVSDPKFGKMAELGRIVRVGFIENIDGLYFRRKFKGSGHEFFESVYAKAAKINRKFADELDTCICR